ncbi:HAT family dimerization domain-containing protein [Loa loa]|uniref:HAT family dimerization domain-containing protein n=1 Tax=Loa loa TaxID=7209 RepID=A0A1S0UI76_LOALO|nr:HAT family dimerization domain-containing protein [Loa loa]EJD75126.1 HAT family dimerization domain-containing protein [Loa loa]
MSIVVQGEAPEPKKFRSSLPTQVIVEKPTFTYQSGGSPLDDAANGGQSPAGPSSARSSSSTSCIKEERERDDLCGNANSNNLLYPRNGQSLVDAFSTAMIFQATNAYMKQMQPTNQKGRGKSATPSVPPGPPIPGAIAAASSPAAALFSEDDWSWHRNPAAAIRSGGTNKQTPVWKFFVYNKAENLSRCIVGNCTYVLKGPHTSTLACHLKKHPPQYVEYQKLKAIYSRDRLNNISSNSSQMSVSPAPASSGSGGVAQLNTCSSRMKTAGNSCNSGSNNILRSHGHDSCSSGNVLSSVRQHVPVSTVVATSGKQSTHSVSNILDVLNARASVAALASGNGHLLQNPIAAIFNNPEQDNGNSTGGINNTQNATGNSSPIKSNSSLADVLTANILMAASSSATGSAIAMGRKWNRDDRKQKEMEVKLALMLSASQLPLNIIENSFFREFMEYMQPRFSMPHDINYVEEIINAEYSRMIINLKNQLTTAKKIAVMIDVLKLNTSASSAALPTSADDKEESKDLESKDSTSVNSDSGFEVSDENQSGTESPKSSAMRTEEMRPLVRLCISVAFYSPLAQRVEVALLGVRPLADQSNVIDAVKSTVEQILSDFDVTTDKVSRYLCNDVCELIGINVSAEDIFPRMLEPYNQKLTQSLLNVIDANEEIEELKKSFYSMILNFVTRPNAMQLLQQAVGHPVSIPIADSFLVLIDAILELKNAFLCVCTQISFDYPVGTINESQWQVLENVSRLLRLFHTHMKVVQDGVYATIDGVVPSLMQLQVSLEKDFTALGNLATQLKTDLRKRTASILDITAPDFDGTFIQATALNPHLALLLDDEQLAYAKNAIEQELNGRMRLAEEIAARRPARLNGGVDALLATVTDRAAAASSLATTSGTNNSSSRNGNKNISNIGNSDTSLSCQNIATSTSLYPDLIHAANERRKIMKERQQAAAKNRYAEAIVQSYFDELAAGTNQTSPSPLAIVTGALPMTLNSRNLAPLQYWQFNTVKYGLLAEIATELLTVPSSTVSLERIFATSSPDAPNGSSADLNGVGTRCVTFDPITLIKTIDEPARMERDAMLRFNRTLIPRF